MVMLHMYYRGCSLSVVVVFRISVGPRLGSATGGGGLRLRSSISVLNLN